MTNTTTVSDYLRAHSFDVYCDGKLDSAHRGAYFVIIYLRKPKVSDNLIQCPMLLCDSINALLNDKFKDTSTVYEVKMTYRADCSSATVEVNVYP